MASRFKISLPTFSALKLPVLGRAATAPVLTTGSADSLADRLDDRLGGDLDTPLGDPRAPASGRAGPWAGATSGPRDPRAPATAQRARAPTKSTPPRLSKALQFASVAALAFVVVGVALPRFLGARGGPDLSGDVRALGPAAPWKVATDQALAKRFADSEPELRPVGLWRCDAAACGYEGRFLVLAGPQNELPRVRLEALLDLAAAPYRGEALWPAFPDTQAQGFRVGGKLYYVVSQSDRKAGAAATMVAGEVIDRIVARVAGANDEPKTTGGIPAKQ